RHAIAIAGSWSKFFRFNVSLRKQTKTFFRNQASLGTLAAIGDHLDVETHIARSGHNASCAIATDDCGSFAEFAIAREGAVRLKCGVVLRNSLTQIEINHWFALGHTQRFENAVSKDVGQQFSI